MGILGFVKKEVLDLSADYRVKKKFAEKMRKEGYFLTGNVTEKKLYSDWVNFVGGEKNVFLRDFLKNTKLA